MAAAAEDKNNYMDATYINFSTIETTEVPNDSLTAVLRIEQDGEDSKTLQSTINDVMAKAISIAKKYPAITTSTDQYYVYQYDKEIGDAKKKGVTKKVWRGMQNITLKSTSTSDELQLIGELQGAGLVMQNMNYSLSKAKADSLRESMADAALTKLNDKGARFAKILNKEYKGLTWVNIDTTGVSQSLTGLMGATAPQMDKVTAPSGEAGVTQVVITITATAMMK